MYAFFFCCEKIKALEKEVGENVDIKSILSGQSNWKGRQQQIRNLQAKVKSKENLYLIILKFIENYLKF